MGRRTRLPGAVFGDGGSLGVVLRLLLQMFWTIADLWGSANDSAVGAAVAMVAATDSVAANSAAHASRGSRGDPKPAL